MASCQFENQIVPIGSFSLSSSVLNSLPTCKNGEITYKNLESWFFFKTRKIW